MSNRTWIEKDLIDSKAFNSLTGYAPQLLIKLFRKRIFKRIKTGKKQKQYICVNCDSLNIVYTEFLKQGISKGRLSQAIGQLLARGFLKLIHQGGACDKDKSIYALSDNWRIWHKKVVFEKRPPVSIQRGFCRPKNKHNADKQTLPQHGL